ncbi:3-isopropylmalate dehydratase small subunit [Bosea sp. BK604]|uniref:3-isopropylmalate dehydratase small subunit n=1 Tax=Bosea sp. BK604 TaxID=2512180 RepID=UPI00104B6D5E|nr:3-isopropylmalate dehydratase small subunit [Bosea sp. BK604]TCR70661.1 3-isopropylmalate dehydratase small subunit [Bosea sp. BK604]
MEPFRLVTGVAASLPMENINTDAIMPTRWIVNNKDLGEGLFGVWRYRLDGSEQPDFVLNQEPYRQSRILLGGPNFGCGSSREEAVWGLARFGIRCVIAPSFGDIFQENAFKNGLLPLVLPSDAMAALSAAMDGSNSRELTVDLEDCTIRTPDGTRIAFAIDPARRQFLLDGLDEIDLTLKLSDEFEQFQDRDRRERPWIYGESTPA